MILTYEAIDPGGRQKTDTVEAATRQEAVAQLRRDGLFVTNIEEVSGSATGQNAETYKGGVARLPLSTLVLFTRQMAMMLRAGSAVVPAVSAIGRQMKKPAQAAMLGAVVADLEEGVTLTEALRKHPSTFDSVYCAVAAAGEANASLPEMFDRLATMVTKRRVLRNKIFGALAYPVLLIGMSSVILLALLFFVVPRFHDMFIQLGVDAPASTKFLLAAGNMLASHWGVAIGINLALVGAAIVTFKTDRGKQWLSDIQVQLPLIGRLRVRLIQAQVFRTMGTLLESGVGVLEALELVRHSTRNSRFRRLFDDVEETVTAGGNLSKSFEDSKIVEPYICQAIRTGEESGCIGEAMTFSAGMLDETNTELTNTIMKLIEPMILIGMGFVVGGIAISLFLPLFDLTSAMQ